MASIAVLHFYSHLVLVDCRFYVMEWGELRRGGLGERGWVRREGVGEERGDG